MKQKESKYMQEKKFPILICENCEKKIQLDFDPLRNIYKLHTLKCPFCKYQKTLVSNNLLRR